MATKPITATALATALTKRKAGQHTGDTEVSKLDPEARASLLGTIPGAESTSFKSAMAAAPMLAVAPGFASAVDWRNKGGNPVSPVRSHGGCGACVSFGSVGLIESMAHIETGRWIDLSEADAHFCSSHGANCGGWWPDQCLEQVLARGVCDEAGFPYPQAFPANNICGSPTQCKRGANRAARITKIAARPALGDATAAKNPLSNIGAVTGCLDVYDDFFHCGGGVHTRVTGAKAGGHCVLVIGYAEAEQCWIIKNSCDVTWGIGGFGNIASKDRVSNGPFFPMYGATGAQLPASGWQPLGGQLSTEPVVGTNKDGQLEAFACGTDNAQKHCWQMTPGGTWSGWASRGVQFSGNPVAGRNLDGRIEVFMVGNTGALLRVWPTAPNNGWN